MLAVTLDSQKAAEREAQLREAYEFKNVAVPFIIYDPSYWLYGQLDEEIPPDYCDEDPSGLIAFQEHKIGEHLAAWEDAYIPFLMPWYGTGVLASGFGVGIEFQERADPVVKLAPIRQVEQLDSLHLPEPECDGLMPRVLNTIRRMRQISDLPVGVTDCQGPLTTAFQIVGYDNMIYWMFQQPEVAHRLMEMVTEALIGWVRVQKQAAGQALNGDAYVLGVKIPQNMGGVWISDDDCVIMSPGLYREFVVPYNSSVLQAFGGGAIHYCGCANQHIKSLQATAGLRAVHNMNLWNLETAAVMRHALAQNGIVYIASDFIVPDNDIEGYFEALFRRMAGPGLIVVPYVAPAVELLPGGRYNPAHRDSTLISRRVYDTLRNHSKV